MNTLFGQMEWGYTITEINKIMFACIIDTGQVYWLVLMDNQQHMMMVVALLVAKMIISEQQRLSFME